MFDHSKIIIDFYLGLPHIRSSIHKAMQNNCVHNFRGQKVNQMQQNKCCQTEVPIFQNLTSSVDDWGLLSWGERFSLGLSRWEERFSLGLSRFSLSLKGDCLMSARGDLPARPCLCALSKVLPARKKKKRIGRMVVGILAMVLESCTLKSRTETNSVNILALQYI